MQLTNLAQLEKQLSHTLQPVYLICSDELLLKQDAVNLILNAATPKGFHQHVKLRNDETFQLPELHQTLYERSLFQEKQVLELQCLDHLPNKALTAALEEYAAHPQTDIIFILNLPKCDAKAQKTRWYQSLEKCGASLILWPVPSAQLPSFILQRGKKHGINLTSASANLIAEHCQGNLFAVEQTLEKILLYQPSQPVQPEEIANLLIDDNQQTIYELSDACFTASASTVLQLLATLKSINIDPILILWALVREVRVLSELIHGDQHSQPLSTLFTKLRIFPKRQPILKSLVKKVSLSQCDEWLLQASRIDQLLKGVSNHHSWHALELFCLSMNRAV